MTSHPTRFSSEQAEAHHWLGVLKGGPEREKLAARLGLARIFERRGMPDEAIELLVTCIQAGHRDPDTYESLARLYAAQHRSELSVRARAEAQQLRIRMRREQAAAESPTNAATGAMRSPAERQPGRQVNIFYLTAGGMMATGGFLFAAAQDGGGHLILWTLPIAGVAIFLRGMTGMLSRR